MMPKSTLQKNLGAKPILATLCFSMLIEYTSDWVQVVPVSTS